MIKFCRTSRGEGEGQEKLTSFSHQSAVATMSDSDDYTGSEGDSEVSVPAPYSQAFLEHRHF